MKYLIGDLNSRYGIFIHLRISLLITDPYYVFPFFFKDKDSISLLCMYFMCIMENVIIFEKYIQEIFCKIAKKT